MANFNIALSGLDAAQKALDVIGNNIANSATEGYHRQRIDLTPAYSSQVDSTLLGGGVEVRGITRLIDTLLEKEILRQQSVLEQISQEFGTLRTIENTLGELSTEDSGLNATIDRFFNSLQDLTAHPGETIWQNQVVSDARAMAGEFRAIGEFLSELETRLRLEVDNAIDAINILSSQVAELNDKIETIEMTGGQANNIKDQRDRYISDISELIGIQTLARENGVMDVSVGGIPLVIGSSSTDLEAGLNEDGVMAITIAGALNYTTNVTGGRIGGLFALKNDIVSDIHTNLDLLATSIIQQINQYHVQGVGSEGSFTSLTGQASASGDLTSFSNVTAGSIFVRVTNTATGAVTRTEITVDPNNASDNDSLTDIAADLSLITGLTASVNYSNQLTITAATGYKYDFLPAVLSAPVAADISFTGTTDPTVSASGIYTGTSNDTLTFTVTGTGNIGVDTLTVAVTNGASNTIATINIGVGYATGEQIAIGSTGIKISLTTGDLVTGDTFSLDVFGDTDTSGVLSAAGINTFFSGTGTESMAVTADLIADPKRVASALGADMDDNANAVKMANARDAAVTALGGLTSGEFYRQLVTDTGQQLSLKQMRLDNLEVMMLNLSNQQAETSGVDINNEAVQLLIFEQMFQAMARYMNTINASIREIMDLL